jgi:hypothetical protein
MKQLARMVLLLTIFIGAIVRVTYAGDDSGALGMARYFPENATVFAAAAIPTEAEIDQLIAFFESTSAPLYGQSSANALNIRAQLDVVLAESGTDLDELLALVGDNMAVGSLSMTDASGIPYSYIVIEIADQTTTVDFLRRVLPRYYGRGAEDDYITFSASQDPTTIAVSAEAIIIFPREMTLPTVSAGESLLENADFQEAVGSLPLAGYGIVGYFDLRNSGTAASPGESQANAGFETLGRLMLGYTTIDARTAVFDTAYLPGEGVPVPDAQRIDPDFARYIPADSSLAVHGTDLSSLYTTVTELIASTSGAGSPNPADSFEQGMRSVGLDWQEDVMDWTTGDYALFMRVDTLPIMRAALENRMDLTGNLDYGLVIEATDAEKAGALAERLGVLALLASRQTNDVDVTSDTINGVDVTVIHSVSPLSPLDSYEQALAIGATDDVFFVATRDAVTPIVTGDGVLADNAAYITASEYFLPEPTLLWYGTGEGATVTVAGTTIVTLALLGPAIGNIYEEIIDEMEADMSTSSKLFSRQTDPNAEILAFWGASIHSIDSASLSATITENGVVQIRVAATRP